MNANDLQMFPFYGMLPSEKLLMEENRQAWQKAFGSAIAEVEVLLARKSKEYDTDSVFWTKQPFGEISFASSVAEITDRLVTLLRNPSLPQFVKWDAIGDKLNDLLVYSLAWAAWRRVHLEQLDALRPVPATEGGMDGKGGGVVPERPPDRTGPTKPKLKRGGRPK